MRPSAFDTTLCETTTTSPRGEIRRAARSASIAPRSSPGRDLGQRPAAATRRDHLAASLRAEPPQQPARVRPRRRGGRSSALAQRGEVVRRVDVEHERRHLARPRTDARPPARARCGARGCRGRSSARSRSAGAAAARSCPVPWRSGTITTSTAPARPAAAARRARRGRAPGCRRGRAARASAPVSTRARRPSCAAGDWPASRVVGRRPRAVAARDRLARRLGGDDHDLVESLGPPSATSTSVSIASASARAVPARARCSRRCLASAKRLTGRTATVRATWRSALPGASANVSAAPATRLRPVGVGHERVGAQHRHGPARRSSATMPSSTSP